MFNYLSMLALKLNNVNKRACVNSLAPGDSKSHFKNSILKDIFMINYKVIITGKPLMLFFGILQTINQHWNRQQTILWSNVDQTADQP